MESRWRRRWGRSLDKLENTARILTDQSCHHDASAPD